MTMMCVLLRRLSRLQLILLFTILGGCHTYARSCTLCTAGISSDRTLNSSVQWKEYSMNCAAAQVFAKHIDDPEECEQFLEKARDSCFCPEDQSSHECEMCPNGGEPNRELVECEAMLTSLSTAENGSVECEVAQLLAQNDCCIINLSPPAYESNPCSLCAEGSEPTANMTQVVYGDTTCNDLEAAASVISNSSDSSYLLQLQGVRLCGCQSQKLRKCNLCAGSDMSPPNPTKIVGEDGQTCGDLHQSVSESNHLCTNIQVKGYFQCGCEQLPDLSVEPCTLCFDNEDPDKLEDPLFANRTNYRCSDAAVDIYASGDGSKECLQSQAQAAISCGCKKVPPPPLEPTCTLCPGGLDPLVPSREIPMFPGISCESYNQLVPTLFDGSNCGHEDLQSIRNLCGCPKEAVCQLCNSGDDVVDANKVVTGKNGDTHSCEELAEAAQYIKLGASIRDFQAQCQEYREEYASDCCPGSSIDELTFSFPTPSPSEISESSTNGIKVTDSLEQSSSFFSPIPTTAIFLAVFSSVTIGR